MMKAMKAVKEANKCKNSNNNRKFGPDRREGSERVN